MPSFKQQMEKQGSEPQIWGLESSPNRLALCIQSQRNTRHSGNQAGNRSTRTRGWLKDSPTSHVTFSLWHSLPPAESERVDSESSEAAICTGNVISPLMVGLSPKDGVSPKGSFLWAQARAEKSESFM